MKHQDCMVVGTFPIQNQSNAKKETQQNHLKEIK